MKKLLLFIALMTATLSAWAVTDGQTYPEVNGIKIVNQWIFDRVHSGTAYTSNAICNQRARTATMDQGIIYVARSEERAVIIGTDTISQSPGGPVVKNPPANAGDMCLILGPGRFHMPQRN